MTTRRIYRPTSFAYISVLLTAAACGSDRAPDPDPDPASWDDVEIERRWLREGFREISALEVVYGPGTDEATILVAARGVAAIDRTARERGVPRWSVDWIAPTDTMISGGDNTWATAFALRDTNEDDVSDLFVTTSDHDGYLVDGATGEILWHRVWEGDFASMRFAMFWGDDDSVPDLFPTGGRTAYSGRTGETLWEAALPSFTTFAVTARLSGHFGQELVVTTEADQIVGPDGGVVEGTMNAVFALAPTGAILWQYEVEGSPSALTAADLDGDLRDDVVVATWGGNVYALSADGELLWQDTLGDGDGLVTALAAHGVDFSETADVFVGYHGFDDGGSVHAYSGAGERRWSQPVGGPVEMLVVEEEYPNDLIVGGGDAWVPQGFAMALRTTADAEERVRWTLDTGLPVRAATYGTLDGERVLLTGSDDALIRALDPLTGEEAWRYATGGFVFHTVAADLTGDGHDEVTSGDDRGQVIVANPADGTVRWIQRPDLGAAGAITALAAGDLDGDGRAEVVAGALRYGQLDLGVLEVYDGEGVVRMSRRLSVEPMSIGLADLDGDGVLEIIASERALSGLCSVSAYELDGTVRWSTPVNGCEVATIAVGDADGDGGVAIAYGDRNLGGPTGIALLDAAGTIRWSDDILEDTTWVRVESGVIVYGGYALDTDGHVTRRRADDGGVVWQVALPGRPDADIPGRLDSGGTQFGNLVPDLDGDGAAEVAVSSDNGAIYVLDGATGEQRMSARLEPEELTYLLRHYAGPIVHVPEQDDVPAHFVVGQTTSLRARGAAFVVALDGTVIGEVPVMGDAHGAALVRYPDGRLGAAVGAGLGVYAVGARPASP